MAREVKNAGTIAATRCVCDPAGIPYMDAEGPCCSKCGNPLQVLLSRATREWLRQAVAAERAKRSDQA